MMVIYQNNHKNSFIVPIYAVFTVLEREFYADDW